ncbi:WXG100 family type VII secretion target [Streptomyces sp. NP-1717]|uniref:WXG100 family type VII secretion target n=1 Tax=unclassified Streptomyces TaxID=2593676 RepID=UPI001F5C417E|nr:WXG100 family type VII secretion target [Streptomyces sp. NP-1717]MCI3226356.1 WXG100 family type VII secretion target [Streptomyces sp. NP-1717]WTA76096.1 WXG100 family type VII secretion target [Streptomyces sp. NBC_00838]
MTVQKVGDQSLKDFQDEITVKFEDVKGQLRNLQGVIDSLEGAWKGIGASAFDVKQAEINSGMVRIAKMLLNFQEAIQVTRTTAGNTEDEVYAALNGVDVTAGFSGDSAATAKATSNIAGY